MMFHLKRPFYFFYTALLVVLNQAGNSVSAQPAVTLQFQSFTINDGLSQGFISSIVQDKKGFMWFTTSDGLNRYDGYQFIVYHHDADDSTSIASDDLSVVFEDSKERLWIGTRNNGLDLFDRASKRFRHIKLGRHSSLRSESIFSIIEDKSGVLWIRSNEDADRLEMVTKKSPSADSDSMIITHVRADSLFQSGIGRHGPAKVFADSRNHVYLVTNAIISEVIYNAAKNSCHLEKRFRIAVTDSLFIPEMLEDTASNSLMLNTKQLIEFPDYDFTSPKTVFTFAKNYSPSVIGWTIDKTNKLWIKDAENNLQVDIKSSGTRQVTCADPLQQQALRGATVFYTDRQGVVWIGTGGFGLLKYDPGTALFHHLLPGFPAYQLAIDPQGRIITNNFQAIATDAGDTGVTTDQVAVPLAENGIRNERVTNFSIDKWGNIWTGTTERNFMKYSMASKKATVFKLPFDDSTGTVFPVYADSGNNVWMGYGQYLVRYDPIGNKYSKFNFPIKSLRYDRYFLQTIYEDNGLLWLGSVNGLFCFDKKNEQVIHYYFHQQGNASSISNNDILSFCRDAQLPDRYLWIGTKGGGLNRLDKRTGQFTRYNTRDGLPNNVVYGILPGNDGNLWLSTNKGLSAFNPATAAFRNFDAGDGLQGNEFNRYAYCKTKDGLLVFGGMNGISYFDPQTLQPLPAPDVALTSFRLFNKPVKFSMGYPAQEKDFRYVDHIHLRYDQNVASFEFAAMDYRKHGNIVYRYRMEGFDKGWINSGKTHEATYTNLDPGTYHFRVQASFENSPWGEQYAGVTVTIIPPWWRTWWFYLLSVSFTAAAIYGLYRFRLYQLTRLDRLRNRIARDLHDEVGSSISTISIYSKIVQQQIASKTFNNEPLLKKINDYAGEIMESMSDIVWNINTKNDAFEHIISRMREHAYQLFEAKEYLVYFEFDEKLNQVKLSMEKRREFYLIYKEALNNIVKYAEGKNVRIILKNTAGGMQLIIKDDGIGFDVNTIKKSGNGLSNMQARAATIGGKLQITSATGKGTQLVLTF